MSKRPTTPGSTHALPERVLTTQQVAELVGGTLRGNPALKITGVAALADATPTQISFVSSNHYLPLFRTSRAGAVLVKRKVKLAGHERATVILVDDPDLGVLKLLEFFAPPVQRPPVGIDPTATVDPTTSLGEGCRIGPRVVIGARCSLGRNCHVHPGAVIGDDVHVGDDCQIFPNVVIRERITLGNRVILNAGSVVGSDGFGYRWDGRKHAKIPQIGTVVIEDDVEIGSCVCIDRAKFSETRVGAGTKVDNLVQIAHNVVTGPHCVIVGQAGIAGSARLGTGVVLGGATSIRDHVTLGDGAMAAARSAVADDVPAGVTVSGMPAIPHRQTLREQAALRRLPELLVQFRQLQDQIQTLQKRLDSR